jgi:hypothetical protein
VELLAFGAAFMPRAWMEANYARLGVGDIPSGPVFDSVMRQVSITYGLHGIGLWVIASDVVRYRPLVILTCLGYLAAGPVFVAVDVMNEMPRSWILGNGGSCALIGLLLGLLLAAEKLTATRTSAPRSDATTAETTKAYDGESS